MWDLEVPPPGLTSVRLAIYSADNPSAGMEVDLLVDTGSILTWIPQKLLARLEIKPRRRGRFKTIHGEIIERDIGIAGVKYSGQEAIVEVVFAADGDAQILGVTTLESLGYRVNPITEELEYVGLLAVCRTTVQRLPAMARASEALEIAANAGSASCSDYWRAPTCLLCCQ